jgi:hypothetical protein
MFADAQLHSSVPIASGKIISALILERLITTIS